MNLPPLREELAIGEGPRMHDGQPSWTVQDPARNRFFRLDWLSFEVFSRWSLGDPELIAAAIASETTMRPTIDDVIAVAKFASTHQLVRIGDKNAAALAELCRRSKPNWATWLVHNYLFFRVPLVNPQRFLAAAHAALGFVFARTFWVVTALALIVGLALVARDWTAFVGAWDAMQNGRGLLGLAAVLVVVKALHEFGHGLAATHFGCRVPAMGIAFLVMTPVAYTDTNEAWALKDRRARLWIGAAGMLAELWLAAWATLAWALLPDGVLRMAAFVVATTTLIKSLVVNTSPVMRFDGYYLLSDYLDLPNLHPRAFAYARWKLRELLFGWGAPPPERFPRALSRLLIGLAFYIWIYRLVVFVGIAIFVYHAFFKALGIVLFAIEIGWFIVLPIASELKHWWSHRREFASTRRSWVVAGAVIAAVALLCVPLPQRVKLSGLLSPSQQFRVVAPVAAQLTALNVRDGQRVAAGQLLMNFTASDVAARAERARARHAAVADELSSAATDASKRARVPVLQAELATAVEAQSGAEVALQELAPRAPFAGVVRLADCDLRAGETVARQEHIATIVGDRHWEVVGYVDEQQLHLVTSGAIAHFQPDGQAPILVPLEVVSVDADATRSLPQPVLASAAGGSVPVRVAETEWVPEHAVYRVALRVPADLQIAPQVRRGTVVISAGAESVAARFVRHATSVLWRELGF